MKIIAETQRKIFLVKMTDIELANVLGSGYASEIKQDFVNKAILSEIDIPISDIFSQYNRVRNLLNSAPYNTARAQLKNMLEALSPIDDKIKDISEMNIHQEIDLTKLLP